jgi:hypothetical protein
LPSATATSRSNSSSSEAASCHPLSSRKATVLT